MGEGNDHEDPLRMKLEEAVGEDFTLSVVSQGLDA